MEKKVDEHLKKYGGKLYEVLGNNPISKNIESFKNALGIKRSRFYSFFGSTDDNLPDYPEINIEDADNLFNPNTNVGEVTISSFYDTEWVLLVSDMTTSTFANNLTSKIGDHFWIGTLENTDLANGIHKIQNTEFNLISKNGVYFMEDEKFIYKNNVKGREFNYTFNQSIYMKMTNLQNSYCLSIGRNLLQTHHIKLVNPQDKFFIAVKYSTITLKKILGSAVDYTSWNDGVSVTVDAVDYDILLCGNPISSSVDTNVSIYTTHTKSIFLYNSSLYQTFFNFFEKPSTIQRNYLVGIENGTELYMNTNSSYLKVKDIEVNNPYNNFRYLRFTPQNSSGLRRVNIGGSSFYYDTVMLDNSTPSPSSMRYGVLLQNGNTILSKDSTPFDSYEWFASASVVFNGGGTQGSDIYDFTTNEDDSRKALFQAQSSDYTYYFPSEPLPVNTTITKSYEFQIDPNNPNVFMGLLNRVVSDAGAANSFENGDYATINLRTGAIEIEGQPYSVTFDNLPATVLFSITKLFDGRTMISIGTNETTANQGVILQNSTFDNVSVFVTGDNMNTDKLIMLKNISSKGILGQTNNTPTEVAYPPTDLTNMGDPFDENSATGNFILSSNDVNTWSVLTFDLSTNVLAAQTLGEGYEMYLGVSHDNILTNGIMSLHTSTFNQIQKSGVNFVFTPTFTQKIYKYNSFSRDLDFYITPTLYIKVSELSPGNYCLSIGVNNYKTRNIKLTIAPTKIFFAVRKGTINFQKVLASSIIFNDWSVGQDISIDASEVDVYLKSEEFNTDITKLINVTASTNVNAIWDYYVTSSSFSTKTVNFSDSVFVKNFLVGSENRTTFSFLENSQYIQYNTLNPLKFRSKIFFNYYADAIRQFDLGEDESLYYSAFLSNQSPSYTNYVNVIRFRNSILEMDVGDTSLWKNSTLLNFNSGGSVGSQIYDLATSSNFPEKVGLNTSLPGQTAGTYFFPSTFIGSGAPSRTVNYIFEYAVEDDVYMGIYDESNPDVVKTNTFFSNDLARVNLRNGAVEFEGIINGNIVTSTPGTVFMNLTSLDNGKTLINIGRNESDANQNYQYNGNIFNPRVYFTSNSLSSDRMVTLKKIAGPAMYGAVNEIPIEIIYPPSNDSGYGDIFTELATGSSFRVTSNSDTEWTTYVQNRTLENRSTGNIVIEGREVFIGVLFSNNPLGYDTANQVQFDAILKSGIYMKFESPFNKNVVKDNVNGRSISFNMTSKLYIKISDTGSSYCLSIGRDNFACTNIRLSALPMRMFFAVRKGTFNYTKLSTLTEIKSGMSTGTEFEIDAYDYDIRLSSLSFLNTNNFERLFTVTSNSENVKPDITLGNASNYAGEISFYPVNSSVNLPSYLVKQEGMVNTYVYDNTAGQAVLTGQTTDSDGNKIFVKYDPLNPDTNTRAVYIGTDISKYTSSYLDTNVLNLPNMKFTIMIRQTLLKFNVTSDTVTQWDGVVNESFFGISGTFSSALATGNYQKNRYSLQGSDTSGTVYFPSIPINGTSQLHQFIFEFERNTTGTIYLGILNQSSISATYSNVVETSTDWRINMTTGLATFNNINAQFTWSNDVNKPKIIVMSFRYGSSGSIVNFGTNGQNANQGKVYTGLANIRLYISGSGLTGQKLLTLHRVTLNGITGSQDEIPTVPIISQDVNNTTNLNVPEDETSYFSLVSPTTFNHWKVLNVDMPTNAIYGEITYTGDWIYFGLERRDDTFNGIYTVTNTSTGRPTNSPGNTTIGDISYGLRKWSGTWEHIQGSGTTAIGNTVVVPTNRLYIKFDYTTLQMCVGESPRKNMSIRLTSYATKKLTFAVKNGSTISFQKIRNSLIETMNDCVEGDQYLYNGYPQYGGTNIKALFLSSLNLAKQYTFRLRVQNFFGNNFAICIPANGFQLTSPIKFSNFSGSDVILANKTQVSGSSGNTVTGIMPSITTLDTDFNLVIHFAYVVYSGSTYIIFGFGESNNYVTVVKNYSLPSNSQLLIVGDTTQAYYGGTISNQAIITVLNVHTTDLPNYQSVLGGTYVNFNREHWISGSAIMNSYSYSDKTYGRIKVPFTQGLSYTSFGTTQTNPTFKFEYFVNPEINVYFAVIGAASNENFSTGYLLSLPSFLARMNLTTGETESSAGVKTQNGSSPHQKVWVSVTRAVSGIVKIGSDNDVVPIKTTTYSVGNIDRFKFMVYTDATTSSLDYLVVFHEIFSSS